MQLKYTLTLADFKAAYRLHRRQEFSRRISIFIWPTLTLLCVIGFVVFSMLQRVNLAGDCLAVGAGAIVVAVGTPILRSVNIRKGYRRLFPPSRTVRSSHLDIDDERIVRENPGVSELKIPWSGLYGFAQDEQVTMLYTNKDCFLIIPTQALSSEQRSELNDLVARHLPKKKP